MFRWLQSGKHFPVGERVVAELEAGLHTIYYESPVDVPVLGQAHLHILNQDNRPVEISNLSVDTSYRLPWTGWSGREMWQVKVAEPGTYDLACYNLSHPSDKHVPRDDRIALLKHPATFDEASRSSRAVRHAGVVLTVLLVVGLYVQHARTIINSASEKSS